MAFTRTDRLASINWQAGALAWCFRCQDTVPLAATADHKLLACDAGHTQHPANVVVSGVVTETLQGDPWAVRGRRG